MDFLRTRLDIPAPRVFAWASRLGRDNPVGAEYIIMEKMQGESLATRWLSLATKELAEVIQKIVDIESRLFAARFSEHGSLYYKEDLEEEVREGERMTLDRGSCLFPRIFHLTLLIELSQGSTQRII